MIGERQDLLSQSSNMAQLFHNAVAEHAERPALLAEDQTWSYGQLGKAVSSVVSLLRQSGVCAGSKVALVAANSPAYVIGFLGAQCLGAVTVEVARHESLTTLLQIIEKTKPTVVLSDREEFTEALAGKMKTLSVDALAGAMQGRVDDVVEHTGLSASPDSLAAILYTSGSTGLPKGVMLSHRNFTSVVGAILDYLKLTPDDVYALVLPLSHSYGKSNLLTSLAAGSSIAFLDNFQDINGFLSRLSSVRATILSMVPFHGNMLLRRANLARHDLSNLRAVTFSGNHLPLETVEGFRTVLPTTLIFSMYGLTESTTRACWLPPERLMDKPGSVGKPIRCTTIRITGENGEILPAGVLGRIELKGPNVMLGYFCEPELTAVTLVDGWLQTGDIGRIDEDGYLYIEGRAKDIIKCAGERISPHEIEMVLQSHPDVEETAVVGVPDEMLGEAVKAFIVPRGNFSDVAQLRILCAQALSHHKMPRYYQLIDSLPKTITGKIKKEALKNR